MTHLTASRWLGFGLLLAAPLAHAATLDDCINQELPRAPADATIASIKARCQSLQQQADVGFAQAGQGLPRQTSEKAPGRRAGRRSDRRLPE